MKAFLIWSISWVISALIIIPCFLITLITWFEKDYHHEFQLWWYQLILHKY